MNTCPLPSVLGDIEYALTVLSWSIIIGPPANTENVVLLITSLRSVVETRVYAH
jgi:hypothetical protein